MSGTKKPDTLTLTPAFDGERLSSMLRRAGVPLDMPCAGNHTCGKCLVIVSGDADDISPSEAALLAGRNDGNGYRLACFARAHGPVTVTVPDSGGDTARIAALDDAHDDQGVCRAHSGRIGAAVDIGTTTVVCSLFDTDAAQSPSAAGGSAGAALISVSRLNAQRVFGADVISRINYGIQNGNAAVTSAIVGQIDEMLGEAGFTRADLTDVVAVGNTTMMHFLCGLDPKGIGFAPFVPESLFGSMCSIPAGTGGGAPLAAYIPPCVSAYVGADLVSCLLFSGMTDKDETALIVDIGTNGEMALLCGNELTCCSTAAGPAFEGAGISCGMTASDGAISGVECTSDGRISFSVIGDVPARGICGSGVVDACAALLEAGIIDESGAMEDDEFVFPGTDVAFTQYDVRQTQLAKAAVMGGIRTLCSEAGITEADIDMLYICGGFGSFLNITAAKAIGLIPPDAGGVSVLGNAALKGAALMLMNPDARAKAESIAARCRYIELSSSDEFMEYYVDAMSFERPQS